MDPASPIRPAYFSVIPTTAPDLRLTAAQANLEQSKIRRDDTQQQAPSPSTAGAPLPSSESKSILSGGNVSDIIPTDLQTQPSLRERSSSISIPNTSASVTGDMLAGGNSVYGKRANLPDGQWYNVSSEDVLASMPPMSKSSAPTGSIPNKTVNMPPPVDTGVRHSSSTDFRKGQFGMKVSIHASVNGPEGEPWSGRSRLGPLFAGDSMASVGVWGGPADDGSTVFGEVETVTSRRDSLENNGNARTTKKRYDTSVDSGRSENAMANSRARAKRREDKLRKQLGYRDSSLLAQSPTDGVGEPGLGNFEKYTTDYQQQHQQQLPPHPPPPHSTKSSNCGVTTQAQALPAK